MLVGFAAVSQAQQGRVGINTNTPASTLDVVGTPTDATRPDALLVPRLTKAQLAAKDAAYVAAQNGALVFVTDATGAGTTKTANVSAPGFYYYDGVTQNAWISFGGGAPTPQRYEGIRGNVTLVNAGSYTVVPSDNVIVTQFNAGVAITLPTLTNSVADIGRIIKVVNNNTVASGLTFTGPTPVGANLTVNQGRGIEFVWTGTLWTVPQK